MENTEEIYTDFARVYDELMDNTPYEMWCNRLDQLIVSYGVQTHAGCGRNSGFRAESGGGSGLRHRHFDRTVIPKSGMIASAWTILKRCWALPWRKRWRAVRRSSICIRICGTGSVFYSGYGDQRL